MTEKLKNQRTTRTIHQDFDETILSLLADINKNSCDCSSCSVPADSDIVDFLEDINKGDGK